VPPPPSTIILFDTHCVLCSRWVAFLLRHERDDAIAFVGAWTTTGLAMAARHGRTRADLERSYLVITGCRAVERSDAGIVLLGHLRAPWRWLRILRWMPRPARDAIYDVVARNRYAWFGKLDACMVPNPATRHRFTLD
jgi:predicted DCC family thiol-disulfide oxidoreductase YuxK